MKADFKKNVILKMDTRKEILSLAGNLIKKHGFLGWSYEDISSAVGIKKASIHYHFPKKSDLILEAVKHHISELHDLFREISSSNASASDKLREVAKVYYSIYEKKDQLCLCLILTQNLANVPKPVKKEIKKYYDGLRERLIEIIAEGINSGEFSKKTPSPDAAAELFLSNLQGLLVLGCHEMSEARFNDTIDFLLYSLMK